MIQQKDVVLIEDTLLKMLDEDKTIASTLTLNEDYDISSDSESAEETNKKELEKSNLISGNAESEIDKLKVALAVCKTPEQANNLKSAINKQNSIISKEKQDRRKIRDRQSQSLTDNIDFDYDFPTLLEMAKEFDDDLTQLN